jgi:hypothetical protein
MKKVLSYLAILFLPALLGGCLDAGGVRYSIDLEQMRGEVVYLDIISDAEGEEGIKSDFEGLIEITYGKEEDSEIATTISRELFEEGGRLNGRIRYLINDMDKFLSEIGIRRTAGGYLMVLGVREGSYVDVNGILIEDASGKRVVWDERVEVIEVELRGDFSGKKTVSLLPYWRQWKERD